MRKTCLIVLASILPSAAQADIIGRWCNHASGSAYSFDSVLTIEESSSSWEIKREFPDSTGNYQLEKIDDVTFLSDNEIDGYRILPSGDLEIFDDMGVISTARPWGDEKTSAECWR